jgi:hypothetical protein
VSLGGGGRRHFLPHFVRFQQVAAPFPSDLPTSQVSGGHNILLRYLILEADGLASVFSDEADHHIITTGF